MSEHLLKLWTTITVVSVQSSHLCFFFFSLLCYRAHECSGCMWSIHSCWQPDLWPSSGPNKHHCQGSSWHLLTGIITSLVALVMISGSSSCQIMFSFSSILFSFAVWPICRFQTWSNWGKFDSGHAFNLRVPAVWASTHSRYTKMWICVIVCEPFMKLN